MFKGRNGWLAGGLGLLLLLSGQACSGRKGPQTVPGVRLVSAPVAFHLMRDARSLLVFDLRTPEEFAGPQGHIYGALNVPLEELEVLVSGLRLPTNAGALVYCQTAGECGERGATALVGVGFESVFLLGEGLDGWIGAKLGVVHATEPATTGD